MSGINWAKNLFQTSHHHGKQFLGIADQGVKTATGIYESLKPAIQNLAPEAMQQGLQKLDTHVNKARGTYDQMRNRMDTGEQKIRDNVGMVMGNLKKKGLPSFDKPMGLTMRQAGNIPSVT